MLSSRIFTTELQSSQALRAAARLRSWTPRRRGVRQIVSLSLLALAGLLFRQALAQTPAPLPMRFRTASRALVIAPVDSSRRIAVPGAVHAELATFQDLGPVDPDLRLDHIQILLRRPPERQAAFDALVDALQTPGSDSFHHWLTPEQVGSEFSPAASDIAAVTGYLQAQGFTVNRVARSGLYIDFSGTARQAETSFATSVHSLRRPGGSEARYGAVIPASLPQALSAVVAGFVSLSNIPPRKQLRPALPPLATAAAASRAAEPADSASAASAASPAGIAPAYTLGSSSYQVGPQDFYVLYNEAPLLSAGTDGTGQTVALLEQTDINAADVAHFRSTFAINQSYTLTVRHGSTSVSCADPGTTSDEDEGIVDAEWASIAAPAANLLYMACADGSTNGIILSAEAVVDDNLAPVMSLSYGSPESASDPSLSQFFTSLWQQAAAQGQTVAVSAGDAGAAQYPDQNASYASHGLASNVLGSTAYNVSAGGTDFQDSYNQAEGDTSYGPSRYWSASNTSSGGSALSYIAETTWNNTCASSLLAFEQGGDTPNQYCDTNALLATGGAGGGYSVSINRPSWQTNTVAGLPSTSTYSGRLMPDVSLFASNGVFGHTILYYQSDASSSFSYAGGTSFVAPELAGVFALLVQKYGRIGLPNPVLYSMAGTEYGTTSFTGGTTCNGSGTTSNTGTTSSTPGSSCNFYDVVTGNNSQACSAGSPNCHSDSGASYGILSTSTAAANPAWPATQGYDMATGLGSINIANLVTNWQSAANGMLTTPSVAVTSSPASVNYGAGTSVTLSATVSGAGTLPTGTVTFSGSPSIGTIGTATLAANSGCTSSTTCSATASLGYTLPATLAVGTYTISAVYNSGNTTYGTATGTTSLAVARAAAPTLTVSNVSAPYGSSATTLTVALAYAGSGAAPSSTLTVQVDRGSALTATCAGGSSPLSCTVSYPTAALAVGTHAITASFTNASYRTAMNNGTLTITQGTPLITVASTALTTGTASATLNATISYQGVAAPTGAVTFQVDSSTAVTGTCTSSTSTLSCTASYPTATLAIGTHVITASLASDGNYYATSSTGSLLVGPNEFVWAISNTALDTRLNGEGGSVATSLGTGGSTSSFGAVAFGSDGGVWSVTSGNTVLSHTTNTGASASASTGGGLSSPTSVAVDGAGLIWVANAGNASVSLFNSAGTAISGASGYGSASLGAAPSAVAVDSAGGVWVGSRSANSVTHLIGAATPVTTPLSVAVSSSALRTRP